MVQPVRVLAALPEDQNSIPSTHICVLNNCHVPGVQILFLNMNVPPVQVPTKIKSLEFQIPWS